MRSVASSSFPDARSADRAAGHAQAGRTQRARAAGQTQLPVPIATLPPLIVSPPMLSEKPLTSNSPLLKTST